MTHIQRLRTPAAAGGVALLLLASVVPAYTVAGRVVTPGGAGIANANIVFNDAFTGARLTVPSNNTGSDGTFSVTISAGTWHVTAQPPSGMLRATTTLWAVNVNGNLSLGNIVLSDGVRVTGRVVTPTGTGIADVDLDVDDRKGNRISTPNDNTDANGNYSLLLVPGSYTISFAPPVGSRLVAVRLSGIEIAGTTALPNTVLRTGLVLSGTVRDIAGQPVAGADIDVTETATRVRLYTPGDDTDASGNYRVVVPTGTYDVNCDPPQGSVLSDQTVPAVTINADRVLDVTLPRNAITVDLLAGNASVTPGAGLFFGILLSNNTAAEQRFKFRLDLRVPWYDLDLPILPPVPGVLFPAFGRRLLSPFLLAIPAVMPPTLTQAPFVLSLTILDEAGTNTVDSAEARFHVATASPLWGAVLPTTQLAAPGQPIPFSVVLVNSGPQPRTVALSVDLHIPPSGAAQNLVPATTLTLPAQGSQIAGPFAPALPSPLPAGAPLRLSLSIREGGTMAAQDAVRLLIP